MRTRTKVLIAVGLALLYVWLSQTRNKYAHEQTPEPALTVKELQKWYAGYNETYFNDKLPKTVLIDYDEHNEYNMATTVKQSDGIFHIKFNPGYTGAKRVALYTLLHEDCHVLLWDDIQATGEDDHGPKWQACMLRLDGQEAFRYLLIDKYKEGKQ